MAPERREGTVSRPNAGNAPIVVGAGLVTLDIVLNGDPHRPIGHWAGGTCGNVLAALAFLGWSAFPVGRLGLDAAADLVLADLQTRGVHTGLLERESGRRTTKIVQRIFVEAGQARHRFAFECPACAAAFTRFRAPRLDRFDTALAAVPTPGVFFFDRVSPMILRLAEAYRAAGALVVFEPGKIGDPATFARAIQTTDVLKYSSERLGKGLRAAGGLGRIVLGNRRLLEIETQGTVGLRYRLVETGSPRPRWRSQPACHIPDVRDTAGAGDWCTAGLLYALFQGESREAEEVLQAERVRDALAWAQALSALSCMYEGPRTLSYALSREAVLDATAEVAASCFAGEFVPTPPASTLAPSAQYQCHTCLAEG